MKSRHSKDKVVFAAFVVGACLLAVSFFSTHIKSAVRTVTLPVVQTASAVAHNTTVGTLLLSRSEMSAEIERLKRVDIDNAVLRSELAARSRIESDLTEAARFISSQNERSYITARVYGEHASPFGTLLLDVGARDGIVTGTPVLLSSQVLFGIITEVSETTALVQALSAPGVTRSVRIGSSSPLSYVGRGGSGMIEAPRSVPTSIGEHVFDISTHFAIGTVGYIDVRPDDAAQRIHIAPVLSPSQVTTVLVPITTP